MPYAQSITFRECRWPFSGKIAKIRCWCSMSVLTLVECVFAWTLCAPHRCASEITWSLIQSVFPVSSTEFKMTIRPAYRPNIIKKRTKKFIRHQSDRYAKLSVSVNITLKRNIVGGTHFFGGRGVRLAMLALAWRFDGLANSSESTQSMTTGVNSMDSPVFWLLTNNNSTKIQRFSI